MRRGRRVCGLRIEVRLPAVDPEVGRTVLRSLKSGSLPRVRRGGLCPTRG